MGIVLRDYQESIVDKVCGTLDKQGKARLLVQAPTGCGKTIVAGFLIKEMLSKGKTVLFLVHRKELLDQTSNKLEFMGIEHEYVAAGYPLPKEGTKVLIGMVQSLRSRKDKVCTPDVVIADECFPAGTLVDGKPIESLKEGDLVNSYNHKTGLIEKKKVLKTRAIPHSEAIYTFKTSNGHSFSCTPNHPIWDGKEYKEAKDFKVNGEMWYNEAHGANQGVFKRSGVRLQHLRETHKVNRCAAEKPCYHEKAVPVLAKDRSSLLQPTLLSQGEIGLFQNTQPYVSRRIKGENENHTENHRAQAEGQRGQWYGPNSYPKGLIRSSRVGHRSSSQDQRETTHVPSPLQNRRCQRSVKGRHRNRWVQPLLKGKTEARQEERRVVKKTWVESIEIHEPASEREFERVCPGSTVYNIEVQDNNNYFANDVLVHNCHLSVSNSYIQLLDHYTDANIIGLTATPCRLDGKGLNNIYNEIILGPTVKSLIEQGALSEYVLYGPPTKFERKGLPKLAGEFKTKAVEEALEKAHIVGDAIKHYQQYLQNKKALIFCPSVAFSRNLVEKFNTQGIPAGHLDSTLSKSERFEVIEQFRRGEIKVLSNCQIVSEGFDVPDCDGVILLRPTASLALYLQMVGRGLRPHESKKHAIILDHVGNYTQHGLPCADREWALTPVPKDTRKNQSADDISVTTCDNCFVVYDRGKGKCPQCGHSPPKAEREIDEVDGHLTAVGKDYKPEPKFTKQQIWAMKKQCKTLDDFYILSAKLGYKKGWGFFQYQYARNKFTKKNTNGM